MNLQEKKWSVEIFRYSTDRGWELYQQKQTQTQTQTQTQEGQCKGDKRSHHQQQVQSNQKKQNLKENRTNNNGNDNGSKNINGKASVNASTRNTDVNDDNDEGITAVPRRGCVEVKKLRLRIHLFKNKGNTTSSSNRNSQQRKKRGINTNNSNKKDEGAHTTVVRRRDTILLSSRRGSGAVVLKFRSVTECIAFSDRLVELNADYAYNQTDDKSVQRPMKRSKLANHATSVSDSSSTKNNREKDTEDNQSQNKHQNNDQDGEAALEPSDNDVGTDSTEAIRSYMVRLLHDEDFLGFVDNIESSLSSAPDTSKILEALAFARTRR